MRIAPAVKDKPDSTVSGRTLSLKGDLTDTAQEYVLVFVGIVNLQ
jgi:hypothetical protein